MTPSVDMSLTDLIAKIAGSSGRVVRVWVRVGGFGCSGWLDWDRCG